MTVENASVEHDFFQSGVFAVPSGAAESGPLFPGQAFEFEFAAAPGMRLSFATMFLQSNDFFYAPDEAGIALHGPNGQPLSGDVTDRIMLWDAGTEADQEPGLGTDQPLRQVAGNTGEDDPDRSVRPAADTFDNLPAVGEVIAASVVPLSPDRFRLRIENVSTESAISTSDGLSSPALLGPGVWVVHTDDGPLFTPGEAERGEGLEGVVEDGAAAGFGELLAHRTGLTSPIGAGIAVVHRLTDRRIFFLEGEVEPGRGLESLAEDGNPTVLAGALANGLGDRPVIVLCSEERGPGPDSLRPGESHTFSFRYFWQRFSLAMMLAESNDLILATGEDGIDLAEAIRQPGGDNTHAIGLWDAGTEVNEFPGAGPNQALRQSRPDTGKDEAGLVRRVDDGHEYPAVRDLIRVTIRLRESGEPPPPLSGRCV